MKLEIAVIIISIVVPLCLGSCNADWWIGSDNCEAYEKYIEQMHDNGMYPDIYGYGWGREK